MYVSTPVGRGYCGCKEVASEKYIFQGMLNVGNGLHFVLDCTENKVRLTKILNRLLDKTSKSVKTSFKL